MTSKAWKKKWIVVMHDDYDDTWIQKTILCTWKQAIRFIRAKHWFHALDTKVVKVVSFDELKTLNKGKLCI